MISILVIGFILYQIIHTKQSVGEQYEYVEVVHAKQDVPTRKIIPPIVKRNDYQENHKKAKEQKNHTTLKKHTSITENKKSNASVQIDNHISENSKEKNKAKYIPKEIISGSGTNPFYDSEPCKDIIEDAINKTIRLADVVFVGQVMKQVDTSYEEKLMIETNHGEEMIGTPFSNYRVKVITALKGQLSGNQEVKMKKYGGQMMDGKSIELLKDDFLLQEGKTYIFLAVNLEKNHYYIEGKEANKLIPFSSMQQLKANNEYKKFVKALSDDPLNACE